MIASSIFGGLEVRLLFLMFRMVSEEDMEVKRDLSYFVAGRDSVSFGIYRRHQAIFYSFIFIEMGSVFQSQPKTLTREQYFNKVFKDTERKEYMIANATQKCDLLVTYEKIIMAPLEITTTQANDKRLELGISKSFMVGGNIGGNIGGATNHQIKLAQKLIAQKILIKPLQYKSFKATHDGPETLVKDYSITIQAQSQNKKESHCTNLSLKGLEGEGRVFIDCENEVRSYRMIAGHVYFYAVEDQTIGTLQQRQAKQISIKYSTKKCQKCKNDVCTGHTLNVETGEIR